MVFYGPLAMAAEFLSGRVQFPDDPLQCGDTLALEVSLLDVSRIDSGAKTIAKVRHHPVQENPVAFMLEYDPKILSRNRSLTLEAVVFDSRTQRVLYRTTQSYPVTTSSHQQPYELRLTKMRTNQP